MTIQEQTREELEHQARVAVARLALELQTDAIILCLSHIDKERAEEVFRLVMEGCWIAGFRHGISTCTELLKEEATSRSLPEGG